MHLAIRADGGPAIGYGHLVHSGALAEEMCVTPSDTSTSTDWTN
jgi:spore coat polysaccharide biosynthesis predicted glycosyltransferase SpsG